MADVGTVCSLVAFRCYTQIIVKLRNLIINLILVEEISEINPEDIYGCNHNIFISKHPDNSHNNGVYEVGNQMDTVPHRVKVTSDNKAPEQRDVDNKVHGDPVGKRSEHGGKEHGAVAF